MNPIFKTGFILGFKKLLRLSAIMAVVTFLIRIVQYGTSGMSDFLNKLMIYIGMLLPFILIAALLGGLALGWYYWWREKSTRRDHNK